MKIIKYILFAILFYLIQILLMSRIPILDSYPFILLPLMIYFAINLPLPASLSLTFFFGLAWDVINPQLLGLNTIVQLILCNVIYRSHQNINKEKFVSVAISVLVINVIYYFTYWLYFMMSTQSLHSLLITSIISILYNSVISIFILYVLVLTDKIHIVFYE